MIAGLRRSCRARLAGGGGGGVGCWSIGEDKSEDVRVGKGFCGGQLCAISGRSK